MLNKLKTLRDSREEGFTLIELLVVIVIIGVLAAIALPIFLNQQKAATFASVKSDVRNAVTAVTTMLVKTPTAGPDEFQEVKDNLSVSADNDITFYGTITVEDGAITDVLSDVAWDHYSVLGYNTKMLESAYVFNSTTGKYAVAALY